MMRRMKDQLQTDDHNKQAEGIQKVEIDEYNKQGIQKIEIADYYKKHDQLLETLVSYLLIVKKTRV